MGVVVRRGHRQTRLVQGARRGGAAGSLLFSVTAWDGERVPDEAIEMMEPLSMQQYTRDAALLCYCNIMRLEIVSVAASAQRSQPLCYCNVMRLKTVSAAASAQRSLVW